MNEKSYTKLTIALAILALLLVVIYFYYKEPIYNLNKDEVMKIYESGYTNGYMEAQKQAKLSVREEPVESTDSIMLIHDYSNYDDRKTCDSLQAASRFFKK